MQQGTRVELPCLRIGFAITLLWADDSGLPSLSRHLSSPSIAYNLWEILLSMNGFCELPSHADSTLYAHLDVLVRYIYRIGRESWFLREEHTSI